LVREIGRGRDVEERSLEMIEVYITTSFIKLSANLTRKFRIRLRTCV